MRIRDAAVEQRENRTIDRACKILDERMAIDGELLTDPCIAGKRLKLMLRNKQNEEFVVVFLNGRHQVIAIETLFYGTIDGTKIHPRVVVQRALEHNARAVILGHNHPSGNPEPSAADRAVTARLKQSLALVDVRLLDHFVIGEGAPSSMAAKGWI